MGGIYIHIPFCLKKCSYCDFYSVSDTGGIDDYIESLKKEFSFYKNIESFDTIYFGGGTPSVVPCNSISEIIRLLNKNFIIDPKSEITLETNPGTVSEKEISGFLDAGINRLNIGIQSFNDKNLKFLGRIHDSGDAINSFNAARKAGFDNIGIDIIYGLPNQKSSDLLDDLKKAVDLGPEHISAYTLTYEENTPLFERMKKGDFRVPPEGEISDFFVKTSEFLEDHGYEHYEISNFAQSGKYSRHNTKYWNFENYLGFGPSAHSFKDGVRWWNSSDIDSYRSKLEKNEIPVEEIESLSVEERIIESVYLGLRQKKGVDLISFKEEFGAENLKIFDNLDKFIKGDLVKISEKRCSLTTKGFTIHDHIVLEIIKKQNAEL